ncbi:MAG TPA: SH3 domain-containing protein [Candidatus Lachnoclostridium stercorigallinarum]|uniref:SH3 domain-containing protein n=1 Tax=Candidatus Lachnoclostridium stercorigallinarum TaxID=2838634 RepID=A0A9D2GHY3_9FIRM|nr:SH3 domain-containing protein [Candidatus Lachnoclostridium stercorigallinarum]
MRKRYRKRGTALLLGLVLAVSQPAAGLLPMVQALAYTERSASINGTNVNVRSGPGTTNSVVTRLTQGAAVTVIGEASASDGALWYQVRFTGSGGAETTGYVSSAYIKFPVSYTSDADFEAYLTAQGFPESYKDGLRALHAQYPNWVFTAQHTGLDWNEVIANESVVGTNLVSSGSISSWKSTADGAYDWMTSTWPGFDGSSWVAASQEIISYYMDPRNFLDENYIFQFLLQSYDGSVHTMEGLETMLKGTFMENGSVAGGTYDSSGSSSGGTSSGASDSGGPGIGIGPGGSDGSSGTSSGTETAPSAGETGASASDGGVSFESPSVALSRNEAAVVASSYGPGMDLTGGGDGTETTVTGDSSQSGSVQAPSSGTLTYAQIIMNAAQQSGVNPYVLAAMIIQENGKDGSPSISGTRSPYEGYYNFYNIGAYATDSMDAVTRGLWYASQSGSYGRPWNTVEKAIMGGAEYYGTNFVKAGQDTFYLKKFNVQGSNLYKHQYMTNVQAAASEGYQMSAAYSDEMKQTALEFKIPVYTNMPATACTKPAVDGSPNNKLGGLAVDGFALTPTFNMNTTSYDLIVDESVTSVTVQASALDSTASVSGTGTISLQSGTNEIRVNVTAQNGAVREYIIHVVRQAAGPTYTEGAGGTVPETASSAGTASGSSGGQDSSQDLLTGPGMGMQ